MIKRTLFKIYYVHKYIQNNTFEDRSIYTDMSGVCKSGGTVCLDGFCRMCEYCDILSSLWLWRANVNVIILSLLILCEALQGRLEAASLQRALWGRTCPWEGRQMSGINACAGSAYRWTPASVRMTQDTALAGAGPQTCEKTFLWAIRKETKVSSHRQMTAQVPCLFELNEVSLERWIHPDLELTNLIHISLPSESFYLNYEVNVCLTNSCDASLQQQI